MRVFTLCATALLLALPVSADVRSDIFVNTLDAPEGGPVLDCTGATDYQQPLDAANFGTARTSDVQPVQQAWEDLVDGGGTITPLPAGTMGSNLRVWGLSLEFNAGFVAFCGTDHTALTPYNVEIFADNAGAPGPSLGSTTATPTAINDTGIPFAFTTIFEYDLSLDSPLDMTDADWISVVRQTGQQAGNGNDCYWLWVDETAIGTYDDAAFSLANGPEPSDQTMCIGAAVAAPEIPVIEVPTMDRAGLVVLGLLLAGAAFLVVRRFN